MNKPDTCPGYSADIDTEYNRVTENGTKVCANWLFEKEHPDLFKRDYFISMDGRAIFQFAVRKVPEVIDELLEIVSDNV